MIGKIQNYLNKKRRAANAFKRKVIKARGESFIFEFEGKKFLVREIRD